VRLRVRITANGRCEPPQVSRQIDLVFQKRPNRDPVADAPGLALPGEEQV
jgi:hypothetical protein